MNISTMHNTTHLYAIKVSNSLIVIKQICMWKSFDLKKTTKKLFKLFLFKWFSLVIPTQGLQVIACHCLFIKKQQQQHQITHKKKKIWQISNLY